MSNKLSWGPLAVTRFRVGLKSFQVLLIAIKKIEKSNTCPWLPQQKKIDEGNIIKDKKSFANLTRPVCKFVEVAKFNCITVNLEKSQHGIYLIHISLTLNFTLREYKHFIL